jgi:hypothetical protein
MTNANFPNGVDRVAQLIEHISESLDEMNILLRSVRLWMFSGAGVAGLCFVLLLSFAWAIQKPLAQLRSNTSLVQEIAGGWRDMLLVTCDSTFYDSAEKLRRQTGTAKQRLDTICRRKFARDDLTR